MIHTIQEHGGVIPKFIHTVSSVEMRPLYRAVRESVQIAAQPQGPNNLNRCQEWGVPRVPILAVGGGDNQREVCSGTDNPNPGWTAKIMDKVHQGSLKRVRLTHPEEQQVDQGSHLHPHVATNGETGPTIPAPLPTTLAMVPNPNQVPEVDKRPAKRLKTTGSNPCPVKTAKRGLKTLVHDPGPKVTFGSTDYRERIKSGGGVTTKAPMKQRPGVQNLKAPETETQRRSIMTWLQSPNPSRLRSGPQEPEPGPPRTPDNPAAGDEDQERDPCVPGEPKVTDGDEGDNTEIEHETESHLRCAHDRTTDESDVTAVPGSQLNHEGRGS